MSHINTLRRYNAWRTGEDERTMTEAGIVPSEITAAINGLIADHEALQDKYRTEQSLRADAERRAEKYRKCAVESQDWDWLAAREHADEYDEDFFSIPAMQDLYLIANNGEPTQ